MDSSIYSAMSAAKQFSQMQEITANNIANANTEGFKADNASFKSLYLNSSDVIVPTGYTELSSLNVNIDTGNIIQTGSKFDLLAGGKGFFKLINLDGDNHFKKTISIIRDSDGFLVDGEGSLLLDQQNQPINTRDMNYEITAKGEVITYEDQGTNTLAIIPSYNIENSEPSKNELGQLVINPDVPAILINNNKISSGFKEGSNVNTTKEMANLMQAQRNYKLSTKIISTIKNIHKHSNKLISE